MKGGDAIMRRIIALILLIGLTGGILMSCAPKQKPSPINQDRVNQALQDAEKNKANEPAQPDEDDSDSGDTEDESGEETGE